MQIRKLFILISAAVLFFLVLFLTLYTSLLKEEFLKNIHKNIISISFNINNDVSDAYKNRDTISLKRKIDSYVNSIESIKNIYVYDKEKKIIISTSKESSKNEISDATDVNDLDYKQLYDVDFIKSMMFDYDSRSRVDIVFELDKKYIDNYIYDIVYEKIIYLFILFMLLFILGFTLVTHIVSRPLFKFVQHLDDENILTYNDKFYIQEFNMLLEKMKSFNKDTLAAKERFELAIEGSQDGIWDWEIDKNRVYFSARWKEIIGYKDDEFINDADEFFNNIHKEDRSKVEQKLQEHFKDPEKNPYFAEIRMLCKDGTYKWILTRGKASLNPDGSPHRMVGSHTDISYQKSLEQNLLKERNFNRSLVYNANSIIAVMDKNGVMIDINPFGENFTGYSKEEIASAPFFWARFLPEDIRPKVIQIIENAKRGEIIKRFQNAWYAKDGTQKMFEWSNAIIFDENNEMEYLTTIGVDITQIKEQEQELINEKERAFKLSKEQSVLLSLFDKGDSVLFKWKNDESWSVEYVSSSVEKLLEYNTEDFISQRVSYESCILKDDIDNVKKEVQRAMTKNVDFFKHEPYRIITKSGKTKWVLDYTVTQKDESGAITHFIGYITDITKQKEIQKELEFAKNEAEKATRAKSNFLANMSHEIRTPLNGILGLTDLVLKTDLNEHQRDYLEKSKSSSKALLHVINDILDYSKIESGKLDLENKPFTLGSVMENIKDLFEYQANKKGLQFNIKSIELQLVGDAFRLTQIITNLVGNAIKFTQKGSVELSVQMLKHDSKNITLEFCIKDSGIGIDKETQEGLFSEFTQADSSITREFGGSGLGLAISKQLVHLMNGKIWVQSAKNRGSTFMFTARFEKASQEALHVEQKKSSQTELDSIEGAKILLVEDNKINQLVASGILKSLNLDVDIASNGKEAVEKAKTDKYDLILMDLQMPVMDGFEASRLIKEHDESNIIIALSAAVMGEDKIKTSQAKMSAHLAKPIDKSELIEILIKFIKPKKPKKTAKESLQEIDDSIDSLFGVDIAELKSRVGDNQEVIKTLMRNFINDYKDAQKIFEPSKVGTKEFNSAIHSLKGVSGNISLSEVYRLSKQIHDSEDIELKKKLTPKLTALLNETIEMISKQLEKNIPAPKRKSYDKKEILKLTDQILEGLGHFKVISSQESNKIVQMYQGIAEDNQIEELKDLFNRYDYKNAQKSLMKMRELMKWI